MNKEKVIETLNRLAAANDEYNKAVAELEKETNKVVWSKIFLGEVGIKDLAELACILDLPLTKKIEKFRDNGKKFRSEEVISNYKGILLEEIIKTESEEEN